MNLNVIATLQVRTQVGRDLAFGLNPHLGAVRGIYIAFDKDCYSTYGAECRSHRCRRNPSRDIDNTHISTAHRALQERKTI